MHTVDLTQYTAGHGGSPCYIGLWSNLPPGSLDILASGRPSRCRLDNPDQPYHLSGDDYPHSFCRYSCRVISETLYADSCLADCDAVSTCETCFDSLSADQLHGIHKVCSEDRRNFCQHHCCWAEKCRLLLLYLLLLNR